MGADPTIPSRTPGSLVLVARYGLALALALVAVGLALLLEPLTGAAFFGITVASVAGAALLAGVGPAIAAAAVALSGHMLLVRPPLSTDPAAREDVWQLVFALIASAVVVAAGGAARRARERERAGRERVAESLRREHEMLLALQAGLLPPALPAPAALVAAARYEPAGDGVLLGGDFLDVVEMPSRELLVLLGDVCGKGPEAGALGVLARHTARARAGAGPRGVLSAVNDALQAQGAGTRFVTAVAGCLRPEGDGVAVTLAVAGHPPPFIVRASGATEVIDCRGAVLGPFPAPPIGTAQASLAPGDALVLYSDGVAEARRPRGPLLGEEELHRVCALAAGGEGATPPPERIADAVMARMRRHLGDAGSSDDVALLVVGMPAAVPGPPADAHAAEEHALLR